MGKTLSFVNIYRNVGEDKKVKYNASITIGDVRVSSNKIPPFDPKLFTQRVTKDKGVKYMGSKFPLLITHSGVVAGDKPGVYFTDIVAIEEPPKASVESLDKLFSGEADAKDDAKAEVPEAPKNPDEF